MSVKNATGGGRSETILIMKKNKWNTMNGIFVKGQVTTMLEEGKSKQDIVDFFHNAGMGVLHR